MKIVSGKPFECTQCGDCCRWQGEVHLITADLNQLAGFLHIPLDEFVKRFTKGQGPECCLKNKENDTTCIFLKENKCAVQHVKPKQCSDYPLKYDSRCPGFKTEKEGTMKTKFEDLVKQVNKKFSGMRDYEKAVSAGLYEGLKKGVKTASVSAKALKEGIDVFFDDEWVKVASIEDLFAFNRVDDTHLVHKSTHDLWSIEADAGGDIHIARLFDNNGDPIKG